MVHELKIKEQYYDRLANGEKKFEVRYNDRDYQVGDIIVLTSIYATREEKITAKITYIHSGLGMAEGYVILGIEVQETLKDAVVKVDSNGISVDGELVVSVDGKITPYLEKRILRDIYGINSTPIEAAETIKPMDEVVHSKMETTTKPMDTKILTDRIEKMRTYTSRKDIDPYVAMHEAGRPMEAIKNAMINDDFCPKGSLPYFVTKILKVSTRVTKIELESAAETTDETIERLKRENAEGKEKRKQPKMAVK